MTICKFYLNGNCRFGNRCWNEHVDPSSGHHDERDSAVQHYEDNIPPQHYSSNDYYNYYNKYSYRNPRYSPPPSRSPFSSTPQRSSSSSHSPRQGASFSFTKAYEEVTSQEKNRFAVLSDHSENEQTTIKGMKNDEIEILKDDMKRWEFGKQWPFSCYAPFKICFPGFEDISPEELRWEYYDSKKSGTLNIHLQNVGEHAENMKLKRNEIKNATPQILERLRSLQNGMKQQSSIFGNAQNYISSSKFSDSITIFGTEKTSQQNATDPNTFRFSLSNVSEQPKSLFQLPQFGTQNSQVNLFGTYDQNAAMETSISDSKDSESGKPFSFGGGRNVFTLSSTQQHHSNSDSNVTSTALCKINSNSLDDTSNVSEFIYTELKLLGKLEKEQYASNEEKFVLGKIPSQPPPKELCF